MHASNIQSNLGIIILEMSDLCLDTVEQELVGGVGARVGDGRGGELGNAGAGILGGDTLESHEVGSDTSDVGRGHGGTGQGIRARAGDGGGDGVTRSIEIDCRRLINILFRFSLDRKR